MTRPFEIVWSQAALDDWRRMAPDAQVAVARAVERFPGDGFVIATGPTEYLLLVGRYAVVVLVAGDVAHVDAIRRA
jgi:hypothetical protein